MLIDDFFCKREVLGKRAPHSFTPPLSVVGVSNRSKHGIFWFVQLATEDKRKVNEMVRSCLMNMNGLSTREDVNILSLGSYDCLIGMC
jgi:hypothetical protein